MKPPLLPAPPRATTPASWRCGSWPRSSGVPPAQLPAARAASTTLCEPAMQPHRQHSRRGDGTYGEDDVTDHQRTMPELPSARRGSSPGCSTRLGLHELREVLPAHPVVELLAIRRPPVDAPLADEQPPSDGLIRVDDDLGVAIHDRAFRKVEIERVFGHEASVEHASEGVNRARAGGSPQLFSTASVAEADPGSRKLLFLRPGSANGR